MHIPPGQQYRSPGEAYVEGDASSASYFLAGVDLTYVQRSNAVSQNSMSDDAATFCLTKDVSAAQHKNLGA